MEAMKINGMTPQGNPSTLSKKESWVQNYSSMKNKVKCERTLPIYDEQQCATTPIMKVDEVLHMEGGYGDASYANNSFVQRRIIEKSRPILEESIKELCRYMMPECLIVADLGCSSGPNALEAIWEIIKVTSNLYKSKNLAVPEYEVFLNDLLGNDFNTLFRSFPNFHKELKQGDFGSVFITGMPGSFYGRLFPTNFLHLVHASSSVHFLSEVPKALVSNGVALNEGAICLTKKSHPKVHEAYYQQFANDFTLFLRSRSREIMPGGRLVLTFRISTISDQPDYIWDFDFLGRALQSMVLEGRLEKESLDSFNMPFFTPCVEQVKSLVEEEGSFAINNLKTFTVDWGLKDTDLPLTLETRAKLVCYGYQATSAPILASQFGADAMEAVFHRFEDMVMKRLAKGNLDILNLVISMTRK